MLRSWATCSFGATCPPNSCTYCIVHPTVHAKLFALAANAGPAVTLTLFGKTPKLVLFGILVETTGVLPALGTPRDVVLADLKLFLMALAFNVAICSVGDGEQYDCADGDCCFSKRQISHGSLHYRTLLSISLHAFSQRRHSSEHCFIVSSCSACSPHASPHRLHASAHAKQTRST
jgi:hypothetical protein